MLPVLAITCTVEYAVTSSRQRDLPPPSNIGRRLSVAYTWITVDIMVVTLYTTALCFSGLLVLPIVGYVTRRIVD